MTAQDFVNEARGKGIPQAAIDEFLSKNPGDYVRILSALSEDYLGHFEASALVPYTPEHTGANPPGALPSGISEGWRINPTISTMEWRRPTVGPAPPSGPVTQVFAPTSYLPTTPTLAGFGGGGGLLPLLAAAAVYFFARK